MTPKFKPGDKVRVVRADDKDDSDGLVGKVFEVVSWMPSREMYSLTEEDWYWYEHELELVTSKTDLLEQAIKVLTDAGYTVAEPRPTSIRDWKPGECGVEKDGTKWYRTEDGAIVDTGPGISVWQEDILHDFPVAIKNPKLKLTLNWSES